MSTAGKNSRTVQLDILEARSWVNVPFKHQGRDRKGVDCIGTVVVVAQHSGIVVQDRRDYGRTPTGELLTALEFHAVVIPRENRKAGDVILFRMPIEPRHVAIWTGERIIHAYEPNGKVIEHVMDRKWERRVHSYWRFVTWDYC